MRYLINSWKLLLENPQSHPEKIQPPFILTPPTKFQKVQVPPPLFTNTENFSSPSFWKGGGEGGGHYAFFSKNGLIIPNFCSIK